MSVMSSKKIIYALVIAVLLLVLVFLFRGPAAPEAVAPAAVEPPLVRVQPVIPSTLTPPVISQGTVVAHREVDVIAQVSGQIVETSPQFVDGGVVRKGELLVELEQADYLYALANAQAQLAQAAELLATERGRGRQARREWRDLGNADANSLALREPQLAAAEANHAGAKAARDQAQLNLERTRITAPFDALVMSINADLGQFVGGATSLARLASTDWAEVQLPLTDRQLERLPPLAVAADGTFKPLDATVTARFAGKDWSWQAKIVRSQAQINRDSRVLYVVAKIDAPFILPAGSERPPLRLGQFVQVAIAATPLPNTISVPREAVVDQQAVWVLDKDNRLQHLPVELMFIDGKQVLLRGAFTPGQLLVTAPLSVMVEGMQVTPQTADAGAS